MWSSFMTCILQIYNDDTLSKPKVTIATPALILPAGSDGMVASSSAYTTSLMYHQKNLTHLRSGKRGGQVLRPPLCNLRFEGFTAVQSAATC
jgi:hypothetical protein